LKSDSPGNRPEFSPHTTKASSRRGRKSDARCSPGPATTGKNLKRSANGPISNGSQAHPVCWGSFPRGSTAGEIFKCNSPVDSVKDIQAHLRHARPDTTAYEYMQELPDSVQEMIGSMYAMLEKGGDSKKGVVRATKCHQGSQREGCKLLIIWWALQDSNLRLPPCEGGTLPLS
jgi:hypothetical protein